MARALLVDTNFSSWPILRALEEWGHEVHVVGANPADALAKAHPHHHSLDYSDTAALARLVDSLQVDHLVPGCNDRSYISCAAVAAQTGHAGIDSVANTANINDKSMFRDMARRLGLSVPRVFEWPSEKPACPVIVKPVDAFSGKGITVVRDPTPAALQAASETATAASRSGRFLVEEFVDGQMYSHSAFVVAGRIVQDFWVVEHSSVNPFVVDVSHLASDLGEATRAAMRGDMERMAQGAGLVDGLLHAQFIVDGDRHVIVEVTRRCPGDLYSQLIELSTGYRYAQAYAAPFVDRKAAPGKLGERFIMRHTLTGNMTVSLEHLRFCEPIRIERWVPLATSGDELRPSPLGRIGILFADAGSQVQLFELAQLTRAHRLYQLNS